MLAADYPVLDVLWTIFIFFIWIIWFWLLFTVFVDVFRRHDISGGKKVLWLLLVILVPFLGVFIYIISQNDGMTQRNLDRAQAQKSQFDDYVKQTAGDTGPAAEIDRAKQLLDSGAISQSEFDQLKAKALASA